MSKIDYQIIKLKNGFKAILYPKRNLYSVAFNLYIKAGHIFEDDKTLGLSHFAEHMIFKGTSTHPTVKMLNDYQDEIAFHPNAYTSVDHVKVYGVSPRDNFKLSFEHLTRLVKQSLFNDEDIDKERSVISEEFLRRRDNPDVYLWDESMKYRFKGKTAVVGRPIPQTVENVSKVNKESVKDFYHSFFIPSRMVLGLAGDFDLKEAKQLIAEHFSDTLPKESSYIPKITMKDSAKRHVKRYEHSANKVYLNISWPVFEDFSNLKTTLTLNLLRSILGRRIWEVLREDLGIVYDYSFGSFGALMDVLIFVMNTSFEKSKITLVLQVIDTEIKKFIKDGLSQQEFSQHVKRMNQTSPMSFDYLTSALDWITSDLYFKNRIELPDECIMTRNSIQPGGVHKFAKKILKPDFIQINAIGPITEKELKTVCQPLLKLS